MEIEVNGVSKKLSGRQVLSDISFNVSGSQCVGLVGPNGAGKTTILRVMLGLYDSDGSVTYDGKTIEESGVCKSGIFFTLDNFGLFKDLNVRDNLEFIYRAYNPGKVDHIVMRETVDRILGEIGLSDHPSDRISKLSTGMKQRLCCGRTRVAKVNAMIMDEPFSNLDYEGRLMLEEYIRELKKAGACVVISSHDMNDLKSVCDTVLFVKDGTIVNRVTMTDSTDLEKEYVECIMGGHADVR